MIKPIRPGRRFALAMGILAFSTLGTTVLVLMIIPFDFSYDIVDLQEYLWQHRWTQLSLGSKAYESTQAELNDGMVELIQEGIGATPGEVPLRVNGHSLIATADLARHFKIWRILCKLRSVGESEEKAQ